MLNCRRELIILICIPTQFTYDITKEQALEAMDRIFNYCEEIDWHIPEEEQTGYKMFPDVQLVKQYIMSKEN